MAELEKKYKVKVSSRQERGFRRAGIAFSSDVKEYRVTADVLKILKAEKMLTVVESAEAEPKK